MGLQTNDTEFVNASLTSSPDSGNTFITAIKGAGVLLSSHIMIGRFLEEDCQ
jgi:hypothetical protein